MKRFGLVVLAAAIAAVLVPAAALAKGASEAALTGPGIGTIKLNGEGHADGNGLMQLAEDAGFFPAVFASSPSPMRTEKPAGDLGPRYSLTYVMPGPNDELDTVRQDLYPYATPSPVTYVKPNQKFFGTERTVGGWYVATAVLKDELVAVGLPETPPAGGGFGFPWAVAAALACALALVALLVASARIRRKPGPATA